MIVIYIILCIIAAVAIFYVVLFLGAALFAIWPFGIGVAGLITSRILWKSGHDNIAVILCILSIGGSIYLFFWWTTTTLWEPTVKEENGYFDPMAGKRKRYNADGDIIGYEDKEDD